MDDAARLLWKPTAPAKRGPKPRFTLEAIADTAMAIADEHGLDAVTMQQVASHLGTTKMALYRYLPGRAELDAVMLDRALGSPEALPAGDWSHALTNWADALHRRVLARPWAIEVSQRPRIPGPAELAWFEAALAVMSELPLRGGEKLDALTLLVGHVMSLARRQGQGSASEADLAHGLAPILRAHADSYPHTATAFSESAEQGAQDDALRFGIDRILDGIRMLISERRTPEV